MKGPAVKELGLRLTFPVGRRSAHYVFSRYTGDVVLRHFLLLGSVWSIGRFGLVYGASGGFYAPLTARG